MNKLAKVTRHQHEVALTILEHSISYLLECSVYSHGEINAACDILYTAHKAIGPTGEISPKLNNKHRVGPTEYLKHFKVIA